jgi:Helix-turn-helix domain
LQRKQTGNQTTMPKQKRVKEVSAALIGALKVRPACRYLGGISEISLRRLIEAGKIKPCRNLRHLLIPIRELDRWLEEGQYTGRGRAKR